ncbi:MAG: Gfo/Idh/MocA family oxidoreductase [Pseudomonadales bacterium]|nr:Gfo/Idh/MocA family oxidoreductase [Pseudomonadales bacterium]
MTLKVGLIGCGHIARFHARNIRDVQSRGLVDIDYHAVCDRDLSRAEAFAALGGCAVVTDDPTTVIEQCDAVYVCTETAGHPDLVHRIATAGRHVFCEKPLARNVTDAIAMTTAVRQAGITHQVGLVLNTSPVYRVLEDLMAADHGPLLTAHLRDDQFFPIRGHYGSDWRADVTRAGGGTLIEHSIHDVDLLRRLFGEIVAVRCHLRFTSGHPGIEDVALVTFQHAGGHQTTLTSVWHAIDSRPSSRHLEVFFQRARFETASDYFGTLACEIDDAPVVTLSNDEILARFMALEGLHARDEDLRSLGGLSDRRFLACAAAGRPAAPDFDAALVAHQVVDACYRSAAEQREIRLTPAP